MIIIFDTLVVTETTEIASISNSEYTLKPFYKKCGDYTE
ncbi:MAG: hypothetical protein ACI83D_000480 [Planctomycetota bacterium]|jgi:hypothetical protein